MGAYMHQQKFLQCHSLIPEKRKRKLILFKYDIFVIYNVKSNNLKKWYQRNKVRAKDCGSERFKCIKNDSGFISEKGIFD